MKNLVIGTLLLAALGLGSASAHTISIGSFNAGSPGSVTLVMGTYDHGGGIAQGAITLTAGPGIPPTVSQSFTSVVFVKPAGLIDGDNNFYADAHGSGQWGTLPSDSYTSPTNLVGLGAVVNWQGATFTGLSAGVYTYQLSGMTSQNWNNINSFADNWTGTIVITGSSVGGVPDSGSSAALLGFALLGIAGFSRSRRKA